MKRNYPVYKQGDIRWVRRFAWFPFPFGQGLTIWMEHYWVEQQAKVIWPGMVQEYVEWTDISASNVHPSEKKA